MDREAVVDRIVESGVVAVLRDVPAADIVPIARAINEAGVAGIEITADAERAPEMIADCVEALPEPEAVVGAGTVMDVESANAVIDAGAEFAFAPNLNEAVVDVCNERDVVAVPGVMTPTEASRALDAGADMLKVFPASTVGPSHLSALQGPLGDLPIMPTGGVSPENVADYFQAGAVAVGAGSALVDYDAIERRDWDAVGESAAAFVEAVEAARSTERA